MWQVFSKFSIAKVLIATICCLAAIGVIYVTRGISGVTEFIKGDGIAAISKITMPVLIIFIGITWFSGTYLWRVFWKIPYIGTTLLNQKVCPDLNGVWVGETVSTYRDENGDRIKKPVELVVKASFFGFDIQLVSKDQYQRSTVVQSEIYKDPRDGSFYLSYIFESVVDQPLKTDDSKFDGSAKLHVRFNDDKISLTGVYWTNRCWQKGQQTAGAIQLVKSG
ncbi:hypothetical protein ACPV5J_19560 [Vibrio rotiferianus]|uniref:Cap15 family cyclic dinucleotide receptor domain-containing protein n=1 Tax=Vibrio rotiferianus TaxID=190895 RepID=UPI00406A3DCF